MKDRIKKIRQLLNDGISTGTIVDIYSTKWGISSRQVYKYIAEAKANQPGSSEAVKDIAELYSIWRIDGDSEHIKSRLNEIFENNPGWKHKPPPRVGRNAWLNWKEFTGFELQ